MTNKYFLMHWVVFGFTGKIILNSWYLHAGFWVMITITTNIRSFTSLETWMLTFMSHFIERHIQLIFKQFLFEKSRWIINLGVNIYVHYLHSKKKNPKYFIVNEFFDNFFGNAWSSWMSERPDSRPELGHDIYPGLQWDYTYFT